MTTSEFDFSLLEVDIDLKSSTNVRIWLVLSGENTKNFKTAPSFVIFTNAFFVADFLDGGGTHLPPERELLHPASELNHHFPLLTQSRKTPAAL